MADEQASFGSDGARPDASGSGRKGSVPPSPAANHPGHVPPHIDESLLDEVSATAQAPASAEAISQVGRMAGSRESLPTKAFFSDLVDRWLFLIFAGAGILVIALLKLSLGVTGLITALPPVVILFGYAYFVHRQHYFRLHPDRLGDNCYYLGFIFTLTSLSVALIQLESATADARLGLLETLIGNFGIALSSTIVGIALRVFFIQFRREIEDEEEQLRQDLQSIAARLKDGLGGAVNDLESFRLRTVQVLNEQLLSAANEFARVQRGLAGNAESMTGQFIDVQRAFTNQLTSVSQGMLQGAQEIGANTTTIVAEMRKLITRIEQIEAPPNLLTRNMASAEKRIMQLAAALEILSEQDQKRAAAFKDATDGLSKHLAEAADLTRFEKLEQKAKDLEQGFATLALRTDQYQQVIGGLSDSATRERAALRGIRQTLEVDAHNSAAALQSLQATLTDIANGIAEKLR